MNETPTGPERPAPAVPAMRTMKKWKVLVSGNDGRNFFMHFHVVAGTADHAKRHLLDTFPWPKLMPGLQVKEIEEIEDAEFFLPGIVFKSGKAYFA